MKGFVIAILAATPLLVSAAILLRGCSPATTAEREPHSRPVSADVESSNMEQWQERRDIALMPSDSAMSDEQAMSDGESIKQAPSAEMSATETTENATDGAPAPSKATVSSTPITSNITPGEQLTLEQTATTDTSLRNADFPRTYISKVQVDLTSPNHWVRLTWSGPGADSQEKGPFHSSPGRGLGNNDCDDVDESNRDGSNCTPKGTMQVQGFSDSMPSYSHCRHVTWFLIARGVAFHYYPTVPDYPASHGCVRLDEHAAQLIHNNSKVGATEVVVDGKWEFVQ